MNKSESLNDLAASLAKAQGVIKDAKRDSTNPFFKSKYADLASVWEVCRKPLSDNGISIIQSVTSSGNEHWLDTLMLHSSGQWISDTVRLVLKDDSMQGLGSAITYARRYQLAAFCGIAPDDDDDGEAATGRATMPNEAVANSETREHWCKEHNTAFFMRGKMKSFAHPVKVEGAPDEWCYEHKKTDADTIFPPEQKSAEVPPSSPAIDLNLKNPGEFYQACLHHFKLNKSDVDKVISMFDLYNLNQRKQAWQQIVEIYGKRE